MPISRETVDSLWKQGYRPYEIYTFNPEPVLYCGNHCETGTVPGWEIKFVFSTREKLETYPFFDAIIGMDSVVNCEETWHG